MKLGLDPGLNQKHIITKRWAKLRHNQRLTQVLDQH